MTTNNGVDMRNALIEDIVNDVLDRSEKYGFSINSVSQAQECLQESADVYDQELTVDELDVATTKLFDMLSE